MNWAYRITILTLGFVAFMTFMVVSAFRQNFDLVVEDYYGQELQFQSRIDKQVNQKRLSDTLSCVVAGDKVVLRFPEALAGQRIEGDILFFRPSDAGKDLRLAINSNAHGIQLFDRHLFSRGYYRVQVDYQAGDTRYYDEKTLMID